MIPFISKILGVGAGQAVQPFDISLWDINEYEVDGLYKFMSLLIWQNK